MDGRPSRHASPRISCGLLETTTGRREASTSVSGGGPNCGTRRAGARDPPFGITKTPGHARTAELQGSAAKAAAAAIRAMLDPSSRGYSELPREEGSTWLPFPSRMAKGSTSLADHRERRGLGDRWRSATALRLAILVGTRLEEGTRPCRFPSVAGKRHRFPPCVWSHSAMPFAPDPSRAGGKTIPDMAHRVLGGSPRTLNPRRPGSMRSRRTGSACAGY